MKYHININSIFLFLFLFSPDCPSNSHNQTYPKNCHCLVLKGIWYMTNVSDRESNKVASCPKAGYNPPINADWFHESRILKYLLIGSTDDLNRYDLVLGLIWFHPFHLSQNWASPYFFWKIGTPNFWHVTFKDIRVIFWCLKK